MEEGVDEMTRLRFLKRAKQENDDELLCWGCAMNIQNGTACLIHIARPNTPAGCGDGIFLLVPRPPDGTRCRDLEGNIKVVRRDV